MSQGNGAISRRAIEEGFNQGNLSVVDELSSEGFVNHDPSEGGEYVGRQGAKQQIEMFRKAFPDLHMTVDDLIETGDRVVMRWTATGTHRGELAGLAPTGVRTTTTGMTIDRFEDGKIVESWSNWDTLGLMRQLGASPEPGSLTEKVGIQLQHLTARRQRSKSGVS
jgi:steroid delta-isomerase-like uncharacterized protein